MLLCDLGASAVRPGFESSSSKSGEDDAPSFKVSETANRQQLFTTDFVTHEARPIF